MTCSLITDLYGIFQNCGDSDKIFGHGETNKQTYIIIFCLPILIFLASHMQKVLFGFINTCRCIFNLNFDIFMKF